MLVPVSDDQVDVSVGSGAADVGAALIALQAIDTASDQAQHRRGVLPERESHARATEALREWKQRRQATLSSMDAADTEIARCESEAHDIDEHRARLERQMKTVIAPREAEALQHEIATLLERRSDLDDRALEQLAVQADAESSLASLIAQEDNLRSELAGADLALAEAESAIDAELVELDRRRIDAIAALPAGVISRYERLRAKLGVAAARLTGAQCEGCHLDLSAGELDEVRRTPADQIPDCPQCGRMLVR